MKQTNTRTTTKREETPKNQPVYKVRVGGVQGTLWENAGKEGNFFTASLNRSYKDDKGQWQQTQSFRVNDLHAIEVCVRKLYEKARLKTSDDQTTEDEE